MVDLFASERNRKRHVAENQQFFHLMKHTSDELERIVTSGGARRKVGKREQETINLAAIRKVAAASFLR